jgi:hypothetical protein
MVRFQRAVLLAMSLGAVGCGDATWAQDDGYSTESTAPLCADGVLAARGEATVRELSDSTGLADVADVEQRIERIAEVFATCGDRRGLFPTVYRPITRRAVEAIRAGEFDDSAWAERLLIAFAARYLDALHASLTEGAPSRAWSRYDELAANPGAGRLRVAATGIAVHLLMDLPLALVDADTEDARRQDYERFGELLVEVTPELIIDLEEDYAVDASALFGGFFLGDWVDSAFGDEVTTTFVFQTIRRKAWRNRWLLQNGFGLLARAEMSASFGTVDAALATLDAVGSLP